MQPSYSGSSGENGVETVVTPRFCSVPAGNSDLGKRAVDLAASAGLVLDDWQALVLTESMKQAENRWAAPEVGLNVARQNGKNGVLEARELAELFLVKSELTIHSAHNFDTSMEHFFRLRELIEETPRLSKELAKNGVRTSNGSEGFTLKGKRRLRFRTRTKGGGRGFACDLLVLDEAMDLPETTMAALFPTKRAKPNPQVWYTGSAVDQLSHEHGVVFARVRKRGIDGAPKLAYFEWSVEGDNPSVVPFDVLRDRAAWAQANPALGIRIDPETMEQELQALDPRTFAVELLGVGDWPRLDRIGSKLDVAAFRELEDENSTVLDPVCFAFDVSPDRFSSVAAAGRRADGRYHIEVIASRRGTNWVPAFVAERVKRHKPSAVVCDGIGSAPSLIPALEQLGVTVEQLTAAEHAQACGRLVDAIDEANLRYRPSPELMGAVRAAGTRPLGDKWAWSRKDSAANISPLVSVTLALSAAMTVQPRKPAYAWA